MPPMHLTSTYRKPNFLGPATPLLSAGISGSLGWRSHKRPERSQCASAACCLRRHARAPHLSVSVTYVFHREVPIGVARVVDAASGCPLKRRVLPPPRLLPASCAQRLAARPGAGLPLLGPGCLLKGIPHPHPSSDIRPLHRPTPGWTPSPVLRTSDHQRPYSGRCDSVWYNTRQHKWLFPPSLQHPCYEPAQPSTHPPTPTTLPSHCYPLTTTPSPLNVPFVPPLLHLLGAQCPILLASRARPSFTSTVLLSWVMSRRPLSKLLFMTMPTTRLPSPLLVGFFFPPPSLADFPASPTSSILHNATVFYPPPAGPSMKLDTARVHLQRPHALRRASSFGHISTVSTVSSSPERIEGCVDLLRSVNPSVRVAKASNEWQVSAVLAAPKRPKGCD